MEQITNRTELLIAETKIKVKVIIMNFVFKPVLSGILGFIMFFAVITFTKFLGYSVGTKEKFIVEAGDIYLSLLGFVLVLLIKFLENFREKAN